MISVYFYPNDCIIRGIPTRNNIMNFATWIDTLVSEKGLDLEKDIEVEGESGLNWIPLQVVIEAIKKAIPAHQKGIKTTLVKIDFANGDVMHFFNHLAKALAI